jgi:hypothetical protein
VSYLLPVHKAEDWKLLVHTCMCIKAEFIDVQCFTIRCNSWHCDGKWQDTKPCTDTVLQATPTTSAATATYTGPSTEGFAGPVSLKPKGFSCRDYRNSHGNSNCSWGYSSSSVTGSAAESTGNSMYRLPHNRIPNILFSLYY